MRVVSTKIMITHVFRKFQNNRCVKIEQLFLTMRRLYQPTEHMLSKKKLYWHKCVNVLYTSNVVAWTFFSSISNANVFYSAVFVLLFATLFVKDKPLGWSSGQRILWRNNKWRLIDDWPQTRMKLLNFGSPPMNSFQTFSGATITASYLDDKLFVHSLQYCRRHKYEVVYHP